MRLRSRLRPSRPPLREVGHEPDYRFSLANERTFLAWIRTALALDAAGLAVIEVLPPFGVAFAREALGVVLVVLGIAVAASSYRRWERNQRALRADAPLPVSRMPRVLAIGLALVSAAAVLLLLAAPGGS